MAAVLSFTEDTFLESDMDDELVRTTLKAAKGGLDPADPASPRGATTQAGGRDLGAPSSLALWLPHTAISLLLLALLIASFLRFHCKHGYKYRKPSAPPQVGYKYRKPSAPPQVGYKY